MAVFSAEPQGKPASGHPHQPGGKRVLSHAAQTRPVVVGSRDSRRPATTRSCRRSCADPLAATSSISARTRSLGDRNPLCPGILSLLPSFSPSCSVGGIFSRYACASLPPDPSGLSTSKTSSGSTHTSSQPDLWGIHLIHNRWPVHIFFAI